MKKNILNLILIIVLIIIPFIYLEVISAGIKGDINSINEKSKENSSRISTNNNEIGDVEGHAAIANSVVTGIGLGATIFTAFLVTILYIISFGFGSVVLILSIIATVIYKKKIAYRVLMSIVYFLYLVIELILLGVVAYHFSLAIFIFALLIPIFIGINMFNTYSNKMFENKEIKAN